VGTAVYQILRYAFGLGDTISMGLAFLAALTPKLLRTAYIPDHVSMMLSGINKKPVDTE